MSKRDEETPIKCVFMYLEIPADLGRCKLVCKKWRDILTKDDYMGRCLCARQWPSVSRAQSRYMTSLFSYIYRTMNDRKLFTSYERIFIPKSSINDYKLYLDIWNGDDGSLILSKVIPASTLSRKRRYSIPSPGVSDPLVRHHLESSDYKLIAPIEPRLTIPRLKSVNVSLLVGRGNHETACIIHKSTTHAVLPYASFAAAFNDLDFCRSTNVFFSPHVRAWMCMYFMDDDINGEDDNVDVFGIELGFSSLPVYKEIKLHTDRKDYWHPNNSVVILSEFDESKFLCVLDALDWNKYSHHKIVEPVKKREYYNQILEVVFLFLEGTDLANCLLVCKQWRDMGEDEYLWKCVCAKGWPSIFKELLLHQNITSYHQLFAKYMLKPPRYRRVLEWPPPILDIKDVEMYLDIWEGISHRGRLVYSKAISGASLLAGGIDVSAPGICDAIKSHLESSEFKMTIPIEPTLSIRLESCANMSFLVVRKDINKVAILGWADFDYHDLKECRSTTFSYPRFYAKYPFTPIIRVCFSLLCMNTEEWTSRKEAEVFGVELEFYDGGNVFNSKEQVLWLLHMLNWK